MANEKYPATQAKSMAQSFANFAVVAFIMLFVLFTYTFLHEGGHALMGLCFGGTITALDLSFWDLSAYVGIEGDFTPLQHGIIGVAGVGLPYVVWAWLLILSPSKIDPVLGWLRVTGSLAVINSLLAWVVLPLTFSQLHISGDDSISFLNYTQANPLLVSGTALAFYFGGWLLLIWRAGSPYPLLIDLRRQAGEMFTSSAVASLRKLIAIFSIGLAMGGGTSLYLSNTYQYGLPPGYTLVRVVDLSVRSYSDEVVHRFFLANESDFNLQFRIQDVTSGPMVIEMKGPDGYDTTFLRMGAESNIGLARVRPQGLKLSKGEYEIRFTFPQAPGKVEIVEKPGM